jgi:hypothetical protein
MACFTERCISLASHDGPYPSLLLLPLLLLLLSSLPTLDLPSRRRQIRLRSTQTTLSVSDSRHHRLVRGPSPGQLAFAHCGVCWLIGPFHIATHRVSPCRPRLRRCLCCRRSCDVRCDGGLTRSMSRNPVFPAPDRRQRIAKGDSRLTTGIRSGLILGARSTEWTLCVPGTRPCATRRNAVTTLNTQLCNVFVMRL